MDIGEVFAYTQFMRNLRLLAYVMDFAILLIIAGVWTVAWNVIESQGWFPGNPEGFIFSEQDIVAFCTLIAGYFIIPAVYFALKQGQSFGMKHKWLLLCKKDWKIAEQEALPTDDLAEPVSRLRTWTWGMSLFILSFFSLGLYPLMIFGVISWIPHIRLPHDIICGVVTVLDEENMR